MWSFSLLASRLPSFLKAELRLLVFLMNQNFFFISRPWLTGVRWVAGCHGNKQRGSERGLGCFSFPVISLIAHLFSAISPRCLFLFLWPQAKDHLQTCCSIDPPQDVCWVNGNMGLKLCGQGVCICFLLSIELCRLGLVQRFKSSVNYLKLLYSIYYC